MEDETQADRRKETERLEIKSEEGTTKKKEERKKVDKDGPRAEEEGTTVYIFLCDTPSSSILPLPFSNRLLSRGFFLQTPSNQHEHEHADAGGLASARPV